MTPTNSCLDGETLAAWVDGGLTRSDAAMAEAHVSSCPRCQEIAGLIVKTMPAAVADVPWWRRRAAWLVPVTVGATAAGLLLIAPTDPAPRPVLPPVTSQPAAPQLESAQKADTPAAPPVASPAPPRSTESRSAAANPAETKATQARTADAKKERQRDERATVLADASPRAPAAPPPVAEPGTAAPAAAAGGIAGGQLARPSLGAAAGKLAISPDGSLHWRIADRGGVERSADGGTTWQGVKVGVTATFTTVQAPEPRTAQVTATDGRIFRTIDGGTTWQLVAK